MRPASETVERPITAPATPSIRDAAWVVLIALAAGLTIWMAFQMLAPAIVHKSTFDYWFESDGPAIAIQLSDRFALENERAVRHPLFTIVLYPVVYALRQVGGLDPTAALGLAYACVAALWAAVLFLLLRLAGLQRIDSAIFTTLALSASAAIFWFPVPETAAPAAVTLVIALAALAWHEDTRRLSWIACVGVCAITLSMTVTNAVAGVIVCGVVLGWRRGSLAVAASLLVVAAGQFVERLLFPHTEAFFLPGGEIDTSAYLFSPIAGSMTDRLAGFFLHGLIAPPLQLGYTGYLSVQRAVIWSVSAPVVLGWALWIVLLVCGAFGLYRSRRFSLAAVLLGVLASQLGLALAFGLETFLYGLQSGPLLVVLAAFGSLTPARRWVLAGAALLTLVATIENTQRFAQAAGLLNRRYTAARTFSDTLRTVTTSSDLIVLGLRPAAAYGWVARPERPRPVTLTLLPRFEAADAPRRGWHFHSERWSPETLQDLQRAGARYFATDYMYGIDHNPAVRQYLETRARLLERTQDWVIYELPHG